MQNDLYKITLALAGIAQAVSLVKDIAQTGQYNPKAYHASIYSIFQTEPNDTLSVYGGNLTSLVIGIEKLILLLTAKTNTTRPLIRYFLSVIHLQKKMARSPLILEDIAQRIKQVKKQVDYFHLIHPSVIANLADIYLKTITTLKFRITVWGTPHSLHATENMEKIRALFFAGVRSAVLWRQLGGSYWQLLFSRVKITKMAEQILAEIQEQQTTTLYNIIYKKKECS